MVSAAISKSWTLPLIFVEQGVNINTDLCIILDPAFEEMKKTFQRSAFYLPTKWSTIPHLNKNSRQIQMSFSNIFEMWPSALLDLN